MFYIWPPLLRAPGPPQLPRPLLPRLWRHWPLPPDSRTPGTGWDPIFSCSHDKIFRGFWSWLFPGSSFSNRDPFSLWTFPAFRRVWAPTLVLQIFYVSLRCICWWLMHIEITSYIYKYIFHIYIYIYAFTACNVFTLVHITCIFGVFYFLHIHRGSRNQTH